MNVILPLLIFALYSAWVAYASTQLHRRIEKIDQLRARIDELQQKIESEHRKQAAENATLNGRSGIGFGEFKE